MVVFGNAQSISEWRNTWKQSNDRNERILAASELSWEYAFVDTDSAEFFALEGLKLIDSEAPDAKKQEAYLLGMMGLINDVKGKREVAIRYYHKSLEIKQELKDSSGIASTYTNIGALFFSQRFYSKALDYFRMAANYERGLSDYNGLSGSFINIAVIQRNLGHPDSALWYLNLAEGAFVQSGSKVFPADIPANRGAVFLQLQRYEEAAREFDFAIALNREFGNTRNLCVALENRARIHLILGEDTLAELLLNEGIALARHGKFANTLQNLFETRFELALAMGHRMLALAYKDSMTTIRDSLHSNALNEIIQDAEARYQLAIKDADISRRDIDLVEEKAKSRQLFWFIAGVGVIAVFLLVLTILVRRSRLRLSEKNKVIALALQERELLMREIHHRVKNNIQAVRSMLQIEKRRSPHETQQTIERILMRLNAMTFVHDHLYRQNVLSKLNLSEYLLPLCHSILSGMGFQNLPHKVQVHFEDAEVSVEQLISLGTILNELITNACKYGTNEGVLTLELGGKNQKDGQYLIAVQDFGSGVVNDSPKGFGTDLMNAMTAKLKGNLVWDGSQDAGLLAKLVFPLNDE